MELKHIKGIGPAKQKKLKDAGITDVNALARMDVSDAAAKTGMAVETLKEYRQRAAALALLEDIKGVGPATVKALAENGIRSLKDFADASAERIAAEAKVAKAKAQEWQQDAEALMKRVAVEAKTAEGRKKLAAEGKEAAGKAYAKGKESTEKLVDRTRELSQAGMDKAMEIKEKAPAQLKELEEKAVATYKEVEVKIKAEGEKVRAANEGFFSRVKARFQKKAA